MANQTVIRSMGLSAAVSIGIALGVMSQPIWAGPETPFPYSPAMDVPVGQLCPDCAFPGVTLKQMMHRISHDKPVLIADLAGLRLRVIRPGDAVTMDHREDRVNIEVDAAGKIVKIWIG